MLYTDYVYILDRDMLEESSHELEKTITEMQGKHDTVDNEGIYYIECVIRK